MNASDIVSIDNETHRFKIHRSGYVDAGIFQQELERIFDRCWLYVGHISELAKPGDFVTRRVNGRDLVLIRDSQGQLRCLLNVCPHRGAKIVREKSGNARSFSCIYHAWTFNNSGKLIGLTDANTYPHDFKADARHQLSAVPLDSYRGLIFVNFSDSAVSLKDFLAGATDFIDLVMDQAEQRMVLIGGVQEYGMRANWKLLAENSIDIFHLFALHPTYVDMLASASGKAPSFKGLSGEVHELGNGHSVVEYDTPAGRPIAKWMPGWGEQSKANIERIYSNLVARFGEGRAHRMGHRNRNMLIFPNLVINDHVSLTLRSFEPIAPDAMDITVWALAPEEEIGDGVSVGRRLTSFIEFLGPGGFATPDDIEALELCQRGFRNLREAPWNDYSKGMEHDSKSWLDETQLRSFWYEWRKRMAGAAESGR